MADTECTCIVYIANSIKEKLYKCTTMCKTVTIFISHCTLLTAHTIESQNKHASKLQQKS